MINSESTPTFETVYVCLGISGKQDKNYKLVIDHNWYGNGSAHILFRHPELFDFLTEDEKNILTNIKNEYEKTDALLRLKKVQPLVETNEDLFNGLRAKFVDFFMDIISKPEQKNDLCIGTTVEHSYRYTVNGKYKYWKIVTDDGTNLVEPLPENTKVYQLITMFAIETTALAKNVFGLKMPGEVLDEQYWADYITTM